MSTTGPDEATPYDRDYYERQYRDYLRQNPPHKLAFYHRLVAPPQSESFTRILDVGCASGLFLAQLDSTWVKFGIDASEYAIGLARRRVPAATFAVTTSARVPFEGPFDVVTAFDVLEHLEQLDTALSEIRRVLTVRGKFVFVVPVYDGPTGPIIRALDRDPTHLHKESRDFWLRKTSAYFELQEWYGILRYLLPWNQYLHVVTRSWRRWAPAIACVLSRR